MHLFGALVHCTFVVIISPSLPCSRSPLQHCTESIRSARARPSQLYVADKAGHRPTCRGVIGTLEVPRNYATNIGAVAHKSTNNSRLYITQQPTGAPCFDSSTIIHVQDGRPRTLGPPLCQTCHGIRVGECRRPQGHAAQRVRARVQHQAATGLQQQEVAGRQVRRPRVRVSHRAAASGQSARCIHGGRRYCLCREGHLQRPGELPGRKIHL